jgi:hypothetical protein
MIYWNGDKYYALVKDAGLIQAVWGTYPKRTAGSFSRLGRGFIQSFSIVTRNAISIYEKIGTSPSGGDIQVSEKIPIVSELSNEFPERFAIETKDIDLLRKLISEGKKVSWLRPDLFTQANYLGLLNFEHVFLDAFLNTHIVLPTGEVRLSEEFVKSAHGKGWVIKYSKRIGFNLKDIRDRINWKVLYACRWKRGLRSPKLTNGFISKNLATNIYNVFSITYLIWRQSKLNVKTVQSKTAPKD